MLVFSYVFRTKVAEPTKIDIRYFLIKISDKPYNWYKKDLRKRSKQGPQKRTQTGGPKNMTGSQKPRVSGVLGLLGGGGRDNKKN